MVGRDIGVLSDKQKEGLVRGLLAALAEDLWPALWLTEAFVSVGGWLSTDRHRAFARQSADFVEGH